MAQSPYTPEQQELIAEFQANARAVVERVERDPDGRFAAFREARAEAERVGSCESIAKFVRELKSGKFNPPPTGRGD
jgi:hypothetical protein